MRTVGLFAGPAAALPLYLLMPAEYGVDAERNVLRLGRTGDARSCAQHGP